MRSHLSISRQLVHHLVDDQLSVDDHLDVPADHVDASAAVVPVHLHGQLEEGVVGERSQHSVHPEPHSLTFSDSKEPVMLAYIPPLPFFDMLPKVLLQLAGLVVDGDRGADGEDRGEIRVGLGSEGSPVRVYTRVYMHICI